MGEYSAVEDLGTETNDSFMGIDTQNRPLDRKSILLFILLIFLSGIIGFFAPAPQIFHGFPHYIEESSVVPFEMKVSKITQANMYYKSYLILNHFPFKDKSPILVDINVNYRCMNNNTQIWKNSKRFYRTWRFSNTNRVQNFIKLDLQSNRFMSCHEFQYQINHTGVKKSYSSMFIIEQGNNAYYAFIACIKLIFFFATLLIRFWFIKKLPTVDQTTVCPQQLYTSYLLSATILCMFPPYILSLLFLSRLTLVIEILASNLIYGSIVLFSLYIIDDLQYQNSKTHKFKFNLKITFSVIYYLFCVIKSLSVPFNLSFNTNIPYFLIHLIYVIWLISIIIKVMFRISGDERYKLKLYSFVCLFVEFIFITDGFGFFNKKYISKSATPRMMKQASVLFYVIIMTYFHWPFDNTKDREYTTDNVKDNFVASFAEEMMLSSDKSDPVVEDPEE